MAREEEHEYMTRRERHVVPWNRTKGDRHVGSEVNTIGMDVCVLCVVSSTVALRVVCRESTGTV